MRIDFRQGVVSYQAGGFLNLNGGGHVDVLAAVKPTTVSIAHKQTNYTHSEDNTVNSAWSGPFISSINYWLYWEFNPLTFERTFGQTTLEPVAQSIEPGLGNADIIDVTPGDAGIGAFIVAGHYIQPAGKLLAIVGSTGNDGNYTVSGSTYNTGTGETTIDVDEAVTDATVDGQVSIDVDFDGNPLKVGGRIWYNTSTNIHYILQDTVWIEVLLVFACLITNGNTFVSMSINGGTNFTGTQIGDTSSVLSGRVLFDEAGDSIRRDDGTFFTTEDQFFSTASRVDGIRIESNVTRAQFIDGGAAIAAFSTVSFIAEGKIDVGQYTDVDQTVIGMLMEDLVANEVGAVVLQGVVTNPSWDWPTVGVPLWVDNGLLNPVDPHLSDPITYPQGRVPVARVLSSDTVVFEQGLGGVGEQGPAGSIDDLPVATTTDLGAVTLVTPSSDSQRAFVITDTDLRLTDARIPLPHTHPATDISVTPYGGIAASDAQTALEELDDEKVNINGDTMTGFLTLHAKPTLDFHAATKNYVDQLVLGLIWLEPIDLLNMISDTVTTPPGSPETGDAYIVPPGASGDWSVIAAGNVTHWDGTTWEDLGAVTAIDANGARFGISFTSATAASGSFAGQDNNIAEYDPAGSLTGFEVPTENNAVYVSNGISAHAYTQYAFSGTSWVLMGGGNPLVVDNTTTELTGNILSVKPASTGGTVDAATWDSHNAPVDFGTNLQILQTDGAGNTDWVDATSGTSNCIIDGDSDSHVTVGYGAAPCIDDGLNDIMVEAGATDDVGDITIKTNTGTERGRPGGSVLIQTADGSNVDGFSAAGGAITLTTGASTVNTAGSALTITSGDGGSNGAGGDVVMGAGTGGTYGGGIGLTAGSGQDKGGSITITSGQTNNDSGGDIKLITKGDGSYGNYGRSAGGILLKTSDGSKYAGTLSGRGVVVDLGQADFGGGGDIQHLHVISAGGSGREGIALHKGTSTSSNAVTLAAGTNLTQDYTIHMPIAAPGNSQKMLVVSNDQADFKTVPYDISFAQLGTVSDGDILGYVTIPRIVFLEDDTSHVAITRTVPSGTDAVFEFGKIDTSNVEVPLGTITITAGLYKATTSVGLDNDTFGFQMVYVKCLTASGVADVSIGIKGHTFDLD